MKTRNINWNYLFKHWLFTLLLGPVISQILMYIYIFNSHKIFGLLEVYPIALIFSFAFSIPTYIIYGLLYYYFSNNELLIFYKKVSLILLAVIGVFITMNLINGYMWFDMAISYSIASIITGLYFKLNFKNIEN